VFLTSKKYLSTIVPIIGVSALYILFAYGIERSEFLKLLLLYAALFFCTWRIIEHSKYNFWTLAGIGILFRVLFLFALPNLSQDFYRFLWDGRLVFQGVNPYLFTPEQFMDGSVNALRQTQEKSPLLIAQAKQLHTGMGALNASHYSNYPPVNQLFFAIAALFAGKSILGAVVVLRTLIIVAEIGILYFGKKLLEKLKLPVKNIFWYFLNPFIIIELTGNLHFEGIMLLFVVWSLYLLHQGKWFWAAVLLGISISVKLLPLLLLPLFFKYFGTKKGTYNSTIETQAESSNRSVKWPGLKKLLFFYSVVGGTVLLTFAPFLTSEFMANFFATISLWFQNFEFNASVYYIIRWMGFQTVGWNIIGTVGKMLPVIIILILGALTFFRKNNTTQQLITGMLLGVSAYFLLSTTIHPWYAATPLLLSVFTNYKFPIVWSATIMLSYSAYGVDGFNENLWLVAVEYIVVITFAITEIIAQQGARKGNFRIVED
jgi:hypothetical protein